jgi:hypothetical protein
MSNVFMGAIVSFTYISFISASTLAYFMAVLSGSDCTEWVTKAEWPKFGGKWKEENRNKEKAREQDHYDGGMFREQLTACISCNFLSVFMYTKSQLYDSRRFEYSMGPVIPYLYGDLCNIDFYVLNDYLYIIFRMSVKKAMK